MLDMLDMAELLLVILIWGNWRFCCSLITDVNSATNYAEISPVVPMTKSVAQTTTPTLLIQNLFLPVFIKPSAQVKYLLQPARRMSWHKVEAVILVLQSHHYGIDFAQLESAIILLRLLHWRS